MYQYNKRQVFEQSARLVSRLFLKITTNWLLIVQTPVKYQVSKDNYSLTTFHSQSFRCRFTRNDMKRFPMRHFLRTLFFSLSCSSTKFIRQRKIMIWMSSSLKNKLRLSQSWLICSRWVRKNKTWQVFPWQHRLTTNWLTRFWAKRVPMTKLFKIFWMTSRGHLTLTLKRGHGDLFLSKILLTSVLEKFLG